MRQTSLNNLRSSVILLFVAFTIATSAQTTQKNTKLYSYNRNGVYYQRQPIVDADYRSFVDLGFGYAKDRYNVYYLGRILPYVDPMTFSLKIAQPYPGDYPTDDDIYDNDDYYRYRITSNAVLFRGKKLAILHEPLKIWAGDMAKMPTMYTIWDEKWKVYSLTPSKYWKMAMPKTRSTHIIEERK